MRRLAIAIAAVVLPRVVAAQSGNCEQGSLEVSGVSISGNEHFSSSVLENAIVTAPSSWARRFIGIPFGSKRCIDSLEVRRDAIRLRAYYRLHGYYLTKSTAKVERQDTSRVKVNFTIVEGPPVIIDTLTVMGLDSVPQKDALRRILKPFDRGILSAVGLATAIDSMVERLHNLGYPYAERPLQSTQVDSTSTHAVVSLQFFERIGQRTMLELPSKPVRIGAVDIQTFPGGDTAEIQPKNLERMLSFHPGDVYRENRLLATQRDLYQLETFRTVDVGLIPVDSQPSDTLVTVRVRVVEGRMRTLRVGGGWATLDCLRFQTRYTDRNLFQTGITRLDLVGRLGHISLCTPDVREDDATRDVGLTYYTSATLRFPSLFGPRNVPTLSAFSERTSEFQAYLRITPIGLATDITRDLKPRGLLPGLPLVLSYRVEYGRTVASDAVFCQLFNQCSPADIARLTQNSLLQVAGLAIARDRTDNLLDPSRGTQLHLALASGTTGVDTASGSRFNRVYGQANYYKTIGSSVLAFGVQAGGLFEGWTFNGSTSFVPPEERFYAGGPNSVRGYGQNLLGPIVYIVDSSTVTRVDSAGATFYRTKQNSNVSQFSATGGNALVVVNVEWRVRSPFLSEFLQFATFVDGGYVWNRPSQSIRGLRWTPGVGIRFRSPVGPLRVDVGYNSYATDPGAAFLVGAGSFGTEGVLLCASPDNTIPNGELTNGQTCPESFNPPKNESFWSKLNFNFSIGQAF